MDKEYMSKDSRKYFPYFDSVVFLTEYFNKNQTAYSIQYQNSDASGNLVHNKRNVIICVTNGRKMLHSLLVNGLLIFFLIFTLFSSAFAHSVDSVEDETLVGGKFNNTIFIYIWYVELKILKLSLLVITEFVLCRYCGSDVTISNFFLNKISPHALSASNQSFYNHQKILVQTLKNSLGVQFKVATVRRANCAPINIRVI